MHRELLFFIVAFCLFFATTLSIRCYTGTDNKCLAAPDNKDCGVGEVCTCVKYAFTCFPGDFICNQQEQLAGATKWEYLLVSQSICKALQNPMSGVTDVTCCSTNLCNLPSDGRCTSSFGRRKVLRKFNNLLNIA
ncbi:unnamed protein product [Rotaria magnacalcarata]|uniref:UPAR/Ly6 domain-containing protein n=1 Tax=Rotaria magnacalcarata TaxID=392030 RepID=A0A816DAW5_9BILA|nr:unnamed protein product [Rotaria magnacalcarata]CAF1633900.1 unnamed protein product [Rotaria magnacalcarata]CAF2068955.1 unnamed protein product [Rotaria magnacalcarata]CAF2209622.1 unnamed protein product [Rotaria magnacalcarata]CAF2265801.1 unnamed protein product [Rotaria magnacalcarata]